MKIRLMASTAPAIGSDRTIWIAAIPDSETPAGLTRKTDLSEVSRGGFALRGWPAGAEDCTERV